MAIAAKNISNVGLKLLGGPKNSLGTVSGFSASDMSIFNSLLISYGVVYDTPIQNNKVLCSRSHLLPSRAWLNSSINPDANLVLDHYYRKIFQAYIKGER